MNWLWFVGAGVVWLASLACIVGTIGGLATGKTGVRTAGFWTGVAFHGGTAILALWLLVMGLR